MKESLVVRTACAIRTATNPLSSSRRSARCRFALRKSLSGIAIAFVPWFDSQSQGSEWRGGSLGFPPFPPHAQTMTGKSDMAEELTKEELDRRAGELAHRLMNMPYKR